MRTDASTVGIDAVPSQMHEDIERPISFASRQLNKAESAYSASELETLAVVWATKYFRCYLYGNKFLVRTDRAALKFLRNFARAPQTFCKRDLFSLYLHWHCWLYRIRLCYTRIVSLIIVSNLMMAKSEMAKTCSWYVMHNCKYNCAMTAMTMHNCYFIPLF